MVPTTAPILDVTLKFESLPQIIALLLTDSKPRGVNGVIYNTDLAEAKFADF